MFINGTMNDYGMAPWRRIDESIIHFIHREGSKTHPIEHRTQSESNRIHPIKLIQASVQRCSVTGQVFLQQLLWLWDKTSSQCRHSPPCSWQSFSSCRFRLGPWWSWWFNYFGNWAIPWRLQQVVMTAISIEAKQLSIQKFWFPETLFEILISLINYSLLFSVESCQHQIFGIISIFTFSITWAHVVHRNGLLIKDLLHTGIDASVLRCWLALLRDGKYRIHDQNHPIERCRFDHPEEILLTAEQI